MFGQVKNSTIYESTYKYKKVLKNFTIIKAISITNIEVNILTLEYVTDDIKKYKLLNNCNDERPNYA